MTELLDITTDPTTPPDIADNIVVRIRRAQLGTEAAHCILKLAATNSRLRAVQSHLDVLGRFASTDAATQEALWAEHVELMCERMAQEATLEEAEARRLFSLTDPAGIYI